MYSISRFLLYVGGASTTSTGGGAQSDYHSSSSLSEAFHAPHQRASWTFDHVVVDVPSLVNSVAYLTRDFIGHERDRETVKIVQRQLQNVLLRRLSPRKSLALLFDGSPPLWQIERTRLFPGRHYDSKLYRSCASPMPYLLEETLRRTAMEPRTPSPPPHEVLISGPATPGLAEGKISAYLLDLATRVTQPPSSPPNLCPAVRASDSICVVGAPELAWMQLGVTPFQNITAVSLKQGELTCCSLTDAMAWLRLSHLLPPSTADSPRATTPTAAGGEEEGDESKISNDGASSEAVTGMRRRLAAVRTDVTFLYLLTNGHNTTGLPQVLATPFTDVLDAYVELENAFHADGVTSAGAKDDEATTAPSFRSFLFDEEPLALQQLDRPALRLRTAALLKLLVRVYRNAIGQAASVPSSSKPTPHAATLLTWTLQTHGLWCSGGVPSAGWSPTPDISSSSSTSASSNASALLDKYSKLSVEQLIQHCSYLTTTAAAAAAVNAHDGSSALTPSLYLCPPRSRSFGLTGAEALVMTATQAEHIHQLLPLYVRGHRLPDSVAEDIVSTRNVHEALRKTQQALGGVVAAAAKELAMMTAAEDDTNNADTDANSTSPPPADAAAAVSATASAAEMTGPHPALTHLPSHLFVRTVGSQRGLPRGWAYYGVHLGARAEALSVRYSCDAATATKTAPRVMNGSAGTE
ncbi:putative mitochondrial MP99, putative,mitochondrial [Leptomonas pyrrhocoris]|uniref:Putative mitochondrial MP99, putative,mitochondrial n=1 Tax=Leptomonas pyrrhocoris TaxID=157538 RepID=A0A0M9FPV6_LEPPY|nr:putative mitochondrial MP99, putative,mitochondrial [Leptomonas pyrrhocoris]KPA73645.1 putative mitochondrial MP99, putative,mitochondrial [Leptomonas pyrrhocoris]|eukprot:XP_015652084.1 putative mitochondrial MP99, putative,mitochondrial [Leptomonas pyrrhocoris]